MEGRIDMKSLAFKIIEVITTQKIRIIAHSCFLLCYIN